MHGRRSSVCPARHRTASPQRDHGSAQARGATRPGTHAVHMLGYYGTALGSRGTIIPPRGTVTAIPWRFPCTTHDSGRLRLCRSVSSERFAEFEHYRSGRAGPNPRNCSLEEGAALDVRGQRFIVKNGSRAVRSSCPRRRSRPAMRFRLQVEEARHVDSPHRSQYAVVVIARYGDVAAAPWLCRTWRRPVLLDRRCGAAMSGARIVGKREFAVEIPRRRCLRGGRRRAPSFRGARVASGFLQAATSVTAAP